MDSNDGDCGGVVVVMMTRKRNEKVKEEEEVVNVMMAVSTMAKATTMKIYQLLQITNLTQ